MYKMPERSGVSAVRSLSSKSQSVGRVFAVLLLGLACSSRSWGECFKFAVTDYEKVFCQIKEASPATPLPSLDDFRRNPPQMQYLLLKRHAQRLSLALAPVATASSASHTPAIRNEPEGKAAEGSREPRVSQPSPSDTGSQQTGQMPHFANCEMTNLMITCGGLQYRLQENRSNKRLSASSLTDDNKMGLVDFQGNARDSQAIGTYLTQSYSRYLEKMLEIGLGASTMSYTKFNLVYTELSAKNKSFAQRFETMYQYLKQDKRTKTVPARLSNQFPSSLDRCDPVSDRLIACDSEGVNWIYAKEG